MHTKEEGVARLRRDGLRSRHARLRIFLRFTAAKEEIAHAVFGGNPALNIVRAHERARARIVRERTLLPDVVDARAHVPLRVGVHGEAHVPPAVEADDHYDIIARHARSERKRMHELVYQL